MILGFTMDMAACLALKKELASQLNEPGLPAKDLEDTAQDSGCPSKAETEDGQCCVFPFTYRGAPNDYCLSNTKSKGKMWCATTSVWDRADPHWGNCKDSSCRSKTKTEDGQCCVFPFWLWGKKYNGCTQDKSKNGKPWCALTTEYVYGPLEAGYWGYCKGCPSNQETEDGKCCVFPFTYMGNQYDYCISSKLEKGKMWCATTSTYDDADPKWGNCKDSSCRSKTKTEDGQCCVFPFWLWGKKYNGCTQDKSKNGKPWCALTTEYVYGPLEAGYWGYCKA